ncbi:DUF3173 domain-containing protein [Listeria monocytogenes]|uniref:DUF3173 family protein n=2 Tax=Listeria monocytogenes TaxID=1639 RepID=UPI00083CCE52|nr:DUF3173 domain-containing protein [Listeria monocytogenes]EAC4257796.1 DUF3173 domain-containing protein [Listeria monocytogenes]EAC4645181.1 DUF3173 domain-containing protein [Listeria monocytogenes]EAC5524941.1 DUF3173 domain-containing protein [Listeria monocytogenes]EAC5757126.1 DUF3173 domain-containing protein [Listeria monocytogenes]
MEKCFDTMASCKDLIELGVKPYQVKRFSRECKEYITQVKGIAFYYNRQVSVVPARVIEKLFNIQTMK